MDNEPREEAAFTESDRAILLDLAGTIQDVSYDTNTHTMTTKTLIRTSIHHSISSNLMAYHLIDMISLGFVVFDWQARCP